MAVGGHSERGAVVAAVDKVGDEENCASALDGVGEITHGGADIGAAAFGLEFQQLADYIEDVAPSLFRYYEFLDTVGEEQRSDLVVVLYRRECQCGGDFGNHLPFLRSLCAEAAASRNVHHQHYGEFALLLIDFHEGGVVTGCDIPVDVADVVAVLVGTNLGEHHAAAFESRMVFAGKDVLRQSAGLYLNLADFFE